MRLGDKVAIVVGGGQTPGDTIGNDCATAMRFAREGARVVVVELPVDGGQSARIG
jgi:NAD(P)-dependent dehydrogenase (short-subunit alcohol dehydrogenase family)